MYDIIIVGGGAAGLFCAAKLAECLPKGLRILLLEKTSSLGNKLLLSGNGQCNYTHYGDMKDFAYHYGESYQFIKQALYHLSNEDLINYFAKCNLQSLIRDDNKVFPASTKAADIRDLLINIASKYPIEIKFNNQLINIDVSSKDKTCLVSLKTRDNTTQTLSTKYLILATGGASYPDTGSTGDIISLMKGLGIETVPFKPALSVPTLKYINTTLPPPSKQGQPFLPPLSKQGQPFLPPPCQLGGVGEGLSYLAGITLNKAKISLIRANKTIKTSTGAVLFTHTGLSGPLILDNARYYELHDKIILYLTDHTQFNDFENAILTLIKQFPKRKLRNIVYELSIPQNLIDFLISAIEVFLDKKASEVSKFERKLLAKQLFSMEFEIEKLGEIKTAMCSAGGVSLTEINRHNMSLKKYPNIYVAGECIDVDGDTGGYNIHLAFASANLIVKNIAEKGFEI